MYLINCFLSFLLFAQSQMDVNQVKTEAKIEESGSSQKLKFFGEMSLESKRQNLGEQRASVNPGIQNLSVGINYQLLPELVGTFELLGQQNNKDTEVYFGQVFLLYEIPFYRSLNFSLGQMYYQYGVLTGQEGLLTRRPAYYSDLLVSRRGIDLGGCVGWQPLENLPLELSYAYFSGQIHRTGDSNPLKAQVDPQILSLTYAPKYLTAKTSYLVRQYENRPQFKAFGVSVESSEFLFWKNRVRLSGLTEYWNLNYQRVDGLKREADTWLGGIQFELFHIYYRGLYSQEDWSSGAGLNNKTRFRLNGLGIRINKHINFEYQNIREDQNQSTLSLSTQNEEAWRLVLQL